MIDVNSIAYTSWENDIVNSAITYMWGPTLLQKPTHVYFHFYIITKYSRLKNVFWLLWLNAEEGSYRDDYGHHPDIISISLCILHML